MIVNEWNHKYLHKLSPFLSFFSRLLLNHMVFGIPVLVHGSIYLTPILYPLKLDTLHAVCHKYHLHFYTNYTKMLPFPEK